MENYSLLTLEEVKDLVCEAHGINWNEWTDEPENAPSQNQDGLYKRKEIMAWMGY